MADKCARLSCFFNPRGIAVVGASNRVDSPGYVVIKQLKKKYGGRIYPVNPKYTSIQGLPAYSSLSEVPDPVDLAVLIVSAKRVPGLVEEAGRRGIGGVIVVSGGFAEVGGEGVALQEALVEAASRYGVRVIGPNCIGVLDNRSGVDTFFLPEERLPRPGRGPISIISQSGALLSMWLDWMAGRGMGVAKAVSYGNKVDVDDPELIEYLADDEDTAIILVYLEGLRPGRGRAFIESVRYAASKGKPVVVLKGGKTERGGLAAASHTASLAAGYRVYSAALRQAGAVEVDTMEEMFDVAKAYVLAGPARGRRVLILTNAGGEGVLATDYAVRAGLEVPILPKSIREKLRSMLPPFVVVNNPVDLTADTDDEKYRLVLETVLPEGLVDMVIAIIPPHPPGMSGRVVDYLAAASREYGIPIIAVATGGSLAEAFQRLAESRGIPSYPTPERAAKTAAALALIGEIFSRHKPH